MNQNEIDLMIKTGELRQKSPDNEKIRSLLKSVEMDANFTKSIPINEYGASVIFKSMYDCIRQLGEAKWWLLGYELHVQKNYHQICMEILKDMDIKEKTKLNHLDTFRKIRNDSSYRAFRVTISQAREILDFWERCGKEILQILLKEVQR